MLLSIVLVILLGILVGVSLSKYQEKINGKAFVQIAKPLLEVRKEQSLLLTALSPKASYVFEVRNYNDQNEINEVEMEYYIEIINKIDESIEFSLYRGEKKIPIINNRTEKIKLENQNKVDHLYRLDIEYDKEKGNTKKDINQNVEVKIHSVQKA